MKHFSPLYDELGPKFEQVVVKLSTLRCIFSLKPTRATHQQIKQEVPKKHEAETISKLLTVYGIQK